MIIWRLWLFAIFSLISWSSLLLSIVKPCTCFPALQQCQAVKNNSINCWLIIYMKLLLTEHKWCHENRGKIKQEYRNPTWQDEAVLGYNPLKTDRGSPHIPIKVAYFCCQTGVWLCLWLTSWAGVWFCQCGLGQLNCANLQSLRETERERRERENAQETK